VTRGFEHLLLTRFNVPFDPWQRDRRAVPVRSDAWLEHRFGLFERFCLPSVRAQSLREFRWLVFFDERTPERFRRRAEACAAKAPFELRFAAHYRELVPQVVAALRPDTRSLCTTRLDNDDALQRGALARVQAACAEARRREWLNLPQGYVCAADADRLGDLYAWRHEANPFVSLFEPEFAAAPLTAWCVSHEALSSVAPVRQLEGEAAWLCVVHARNLRNALPEARAFAALRRWLRRGLRLAEPAGPRPIALRLADVASEFGCGA